MTIYAYPTGPAITLIGVSGHKDGTVMQLTLDVCANANPITGWTQDQVLGQFTVTGVGGLALSAAIIPALRAWAAANLQGGNDLATTNAAIAGMTREDWKARYSG